MARFPSLVALYVCITFSTGTLAQSKQPSWAELQPYQKIILHPLEQDWDTLEPDQKKEMGEDD